MPDQKLSLPSSQGGLVRYYDEVKSSIQIKPMHVVILIFAVIVAELILHATG